MKHFSLQKRMVFVGLNILVFFLLVAAFFDTTYRWNNFESYSENLVSGRIYAALNDLPIQSTNALGFLHVEGSPCQDDYSAYYQYPDRYAAEEDTLSRENYYFEGYGAQMGLQGAVFTFVAHVLHHPKTYLICRIACIAALILVLMLISWQLVALYNPLMGIVFLLVSALSPWIQLFAPNLYWVTFTWFCPMLFAVLCLTKPKLRFLWYLLYFVSVVVKCLCGFEYLSTILVSSLLFLVVEWVSSPQNRHWLTRDILLLAVLAIIAFCFVYFVTALHHYEGESLLVAAKKFYESNVARRLQGTDVNDIGTTVSPIHVLLIYLWEKLAGKAMLLLLLTSFAVLAFQKKVYGENDTPSWVMLLISVLSAFSWFILAKQHSYYHQHLNFVVWFIGTAQIEVYIIADVIWRHRKDLLLIDLD